MSRTYRGKDRKIRVRGIRRKTDTRRLAHALIELEYQRAQTETEAKAEYSKDDKSKPDSGKDKR
jgi:hypothetical protein